MKIGKQGGTTVNFPVPDSGAGFIYFSAVLKRQEFWFNLLILTLKIAQRRPESAALRTKTNDLVNRGPESSGESVVRKAARSQYKCL